MDDQPKVSFGLTVAAFFPFPGATIVTAILFDLDGTLVQTVILKAISYAKAAIELRPSSVTQKAVIEAFKTVVGLARDEVVRYLMDFFELEAAARSRMADLQAETPEEAFVILRLREYDAILSNTQILFDHLCTHNVDLLKWSHQNGYRTGLATMSHAEQAHRVINLLQLAPYLEVVTARDDVAKGKPDPEMYQLVASKLGVTAEQCLVIEDSSTGVEAALAAGMGCIVVTTDMTRQSVHKSKLLEPRWIVDDPACVETVFAEYLKEHA